MIVFLNSEMRYLTEFRIIISREGQLSRFEQATVGRIETVLLTCCPSLATSPGILSFPVSHFMQQQLTIAIVDSRFRPVHAQFAAIVYDDKAKQRDGPWRRRWKCTSIIVIFICTPFTV